MSVLFDETLPLPFAELRKEIESEKEELLNVEDEASEDDTVIPEHYDITSYGADMDVEGLVKRVNRGDIFVPEFQRGYVWSPQMASRFVESLLLGLPVPGIFLAREAVSNRLIVIDGQQRLKTLVYFYGGFFNSKPDQANKRIFKLTKVQPKFEGRTYEALDERDRIKLNDSIIHAIIVKQDAPEDGDTSMYHIFERLNNGGMKIAPQEIRTAIYHGDLIEMIRHLNDYDNWRTIFGKKSLRLKDEELILRFLALYYNSGKYEQPMEEFLNRFAKKYSKTEVKFLNDAERLFKSTIDVVISNIGAKAFRPDRSLNAAVFDSVMVGLARGLQNRPDNDVNKIRDAYMSLLKDPGYLKLISRSTSDEKNVADRLKQTEAKFSEI